jgi:hypothetical protein
MVEHPTTAQETTGPEDPSKDESDCQSLLHSLGELFFCVVGVLFEGRPFGMDEVSGAVLRGAGGEDCNDDREGQEHNSISMDGPLEPPNSVRSISKSTSLNIRVIKSYSVFRVPCRSQSNQSKNKQ